MHGHIGPGETRGGRRAPSGVEQVEELAWGQYPDAGHSFMNRISTGPLFSPIQKLVRCDYDQASVEDAGTRTLDFYVQHLSR